MAKSAASTTAEPRTEERQRSGRRASGPLARVTVNLTARSTQALDELVELTGDTQTDTINRALQIYAHLERTARNGGSLYVRETTSSELVKLQFL